MVEERRDNMVAEEAWYGMKDWRNRIRQGD